MQSEPVLKAFKGEKRAYKEAWMVKDGKGGLNISNDKLISWQGVLNKSLQYLVLVSP